MTGVLEPAVFDFHAITSQILDTTFHRGDVDDRIIRTEPTPVANSPTSLPAARYFIARPARAETSRPLLPSLRFFMVEVSRNWAVRTAFFGNYNREIGNHVMTILEDPCTILQTVLPHASGDWEAL
jgi:hypothetical protein